MIKSKVKNVKRVATYPKLQISDKGTVVFMTSKGTGFVVDVPKHNPNDRFIGEYSEGWGAFEDFEGEITLSNS